MIKQISFADVKQHNQSNGVKLVFLLSVLFFLTYSSLRAPSCSISAWSVEFQRHIAQVIRQHLYRRITVRETVSSRMKLPNIARSIFACSVSTEL